MRGSTMIQDDLLATGARGQGDQEIFLEVIISRLIIVSQRLTKAEAAIASVTASALSEFEDIFASLSLESHESFSGSSIQSLPSAAVSPTQWLLDNIHNPYPSGPAKRAMEKSPELGGRTVNEWFTRARRRIGWIRILRDRFNGCRSATTDAAFRAFVRDDPRSPLSAELCAAFMAVKAHAHLVYPPSPPPGTLARALYSSPPSRSPSATPSLTHSTDSEDNDDDASQPSRKRKQSCSELPSGPHSVPSRSYKRRLPPSPGRISHSLSPSPTSAQDVFSPTPLHSRKRRLSEPNSNEPAVKKPRCLDRAPREQTALGPLSPPTPSFDWGSWCSEAFTLPPSTTTNHPVPDALDFELFNFEAFPASQLVGRSEIHSPSSCNNSLALSDIADPPAGKRPEFPDRPGVWVDPLFIAPSQAERDPWPASWDDFNFELPCKTSIPSLTNSPSSPDALWSLPPPELSRFDLFELPLFDFSLSSLFKMPSLYPADGVGIVDSNNPLIS